MPKKKVAVRDEDFIPYRAKLRKRPSNPAAVGLTGTVTRETLDCQLRFEVDIDDGSKWSRTLLVWEEDLQRLP